MTTDHAAAEDGRVSEDVFFVFYCRTCGTTREIESTKHDDGSGGVHRCSVCKTQVGIWIDGGTLDLGLVRDSDLNKDNDNDFQVFASDEEREKRT